MDALPTLVGILLVGGAAALAVWPLVFGASRDQPPDTPEGHEAERDDRLSLYRQVLDAEFDLRMGKLSRADYEQLSADLLERAGTSLQAERGDQAELDAEIE